MKEEMEEMDSVTAHMVSELWIRQILNHPLLAWLS